jgi:hypothetical protein
MPVSPEALFGGAGTEIFSVSELMGMMATSDF